MPPYLLIETSRKAEGKKIEEKSSNDSQNGTPRRPCDAFEKVLRFCSEI
jgi:hypothetical protein